MDPELRPELLAFYVARRGEPAWLRDGGATAAALALAELLAVADRKGLEPDDYAGARWAGELARAGQGTAARRRVELDVAFSGIALRYLADLHRGRVAPGPVGFELPAGGVEPLAAALARVADASDVAAAVAEVEPPFAAYRRTASALESYLRLARAERPLALPVPRRPVAVGAPYQDASRVAERLRYLGDLAGDSSAGQGGSYDAALAEGVARFQRRHGLDPHGRLDAATVSRLSVPLERRAAQLALALERWRWLPRGFASPPIVVNIPEFRLYADRGRLTMKVAVGRAWRTRTPVFAGELRRVVFRPSWNVPLSIQRNELAPRWARDPAALEREGYELVDRGGHVVAAGAAGEVLPRLRSGELRLRQRPGPQNALGLVKLDLPNAHGVYLHGTPSAGVFARARRDVTHGCIRVEDPAALAAWVLRELPGWNRERVEVAMAAPATSAVEVTPPIPVFVLYGTAVVEPAGEVRFLDDLYGLDAELARALDHHRRTRPVSTWTNAGPG